MPKDLTTQQGLIHFYFTLRGWAYAEGDPKSMILFRRFLRPTRDLLTLCDHDLQRAQAAIIRVKNWAESIQLSWSMETVIKKWNELDKLDVKLTPFIDGDRAQQRGDNWWVLPYHGAWVRYDGPLNGHLVWK